MTMTLVSTITVPSGAYAAELNFTAIPQTGKDLLLVFSLRSGYQTGASTEVQLYVNYATTNITFKRLLGNGSASSSTSGTSLVPLPVTGIDSTSNTFSSGSVYFPDYASGNAKSYSMDAVTENNATSAVQNLTAASWNQTSPITILTISGNAVQQYSSASLYTISTTGASGASVA